MTIGHRCKEIGIGQRVQGDGECTSIVTSRSASTLKVNFVCKKPPSSGEGTYTFSGDTAYTMRMVINTTHQGKPQTMAIDGQSTWLAADCGTVKPAK